MSDAKRAIEIRRLVSEINRYRFVGESGLSVALIGGGSSEGAEGPNKSAGSFDTAGADRNIEVRFG